MSEPFVFHDLVGPEREPTSEESEWLSALAVDTDPAELAVQVAPSVAAETPGPLLERKVDGSWRAGRYVGELRRDDKVLEIRPRLGVETIARWAGAALNVRVVPRSAEQRGTAALIAELLAATWKSALVEASRHGPPGFRAATKHVGPMARGRIDIGHTLRLRVARRPYVASVARPKRIDNPVTRAIVLADRVLDRRLDRPAWRGERVEELIPRLRSAVGHRPTLPSRRDLERVRYTPITLPYRRAGALSWQIARHRGLRSTATGERVEGVLIDVAELWELFLVHCAKRAFGQGQVVHGTRLRETRPLLRSSSDRAVTLGRLYPDIIVGPVQEPLAIIDAKYKPLADPRGVDPADLYQLNAYLSAHPIRPRPPGMLAFTRFPGQESLARAETRGPWLSPQDNEVRFDRLPVEEGPCVSALEDSVASVQRSLTSGAQ